MRQLLKNIYEYFLKDNKIESLISSVIKFMLKNRKKTFFIIGNGGSAASASHFAQDLCKGPVKDLKNSKDFFKAISLTDNISFISAIANDFGYEHIFTSQLKVFADPKKSVLIIISGSGNSKNVINAADWANENNIPIISFTGFDGGQLKNKSFININIEINDMMIVESIHSIIFHYIIDKLYNSINKR